ncbi:MAG: hypothetical protein H7X79_00415 [Sporomusaceae bacterium]|nr:hypothetical protein [Sporomusaceae bacterium]
MDNLIPLLFVALFYLGPTLLKHYRAKVKKQNEMQQPLAPEIKAAFAENKKQPKYVASTSNLQTPMAAADIKSVPSVRKEASSWNGKLDHNILVNGVIFAEILQPPRAYRPFGKK